MPLAEIGETGKGVPGEIVVPLAGVGGASESVDNDGAVDHRFLRTPDPNRAASKSNGGKIQIPFRARVNPTSISMEIGTIRASIGVGGAAEIGG